MKNTYAILLLLFLTCSQAKAKSENKLRIVATQHPLLQYEIEGKLKGPTVEIIQSVLKKANLMAEIEFMPWPRAYSIAEKRPNTLILSMIRTPQRERKFHWLGIVSKLARVFIALKGSPVLTTDDQIKHKLVAVTRNSDSYNELKAKGFSENKNLYVVASAKEAFKLLVGRKVDFVYNDPNAVTEYIRDHGIDPKQLIFNDIIPANRRDSYIAININSNKELVKKLKASMKKYQQTKEYLYLLNKKG